MASILSGSTSLIFHNRAEIVEHLLAKINANKKKKIGSEWEFFFLRPDGNPITRKDVHKAIEAFKNVFTFSGYVTSFIYENNCGKGENVVGLNIDDLGEIHTEAGGQMEFACSTCDNTDELFEKNEEAFSAICEVGFRLHHKPVFKGFLEGYAEKAEGPDRNRALHWRNYYEQRFGENAIQLKSYQNGTASTQITIDSGAEKFHEFFKTLLLVEPLLSLSYSNSIRSFVEKDNYGKLIPSQVMPIIRAWDARTPRDTVKIIVDRLLEMEVPFLPDNAWPHLYKAEPLRNSRPPNVQEIMEQGRLSEKYLNNIGGFFYTRPALRNFSSALLELRGVDSQPLPEAVHQLAQRVCKLIYDPTTRKNLLDDYAYLTQTDIHNLHRAAAALDKRAALSTFVAGKPVQYYVNDIISRSQPTQEKLFVGSKGEKRQAVG